MIRSISLALALFSSFLPEAVQACSCGPPPIWPPSPQRHLLEADAVFMGNIVAVEPTYPEKKWGRHTAVIDVQRVWKGPQVDVVRVSAARDSATCGVPYEAGWSGVFFMMRDWDERYGEEYHAHSCLIYPYGRRGLEGIYHLLLERYRVRREFLERRVSSSPGDPEALINLVDWMIDFGDIAGAAPYIERLQVVAPASPGTRVRRGELLLAQGKLDEARQEFQAVVARKPENLRAIHGVTAVLVQLKQVAKAAAVSSDFSRLSVSRLDLSGQVREDNNFNGAVLWLPDLSSATLAKADFRNSVVEGGTFMNADLRGGDFRGAVISQVDLRGTDLRAARMEGAWFPQSIFDCTTKWPEGYLPKEAEAKHVDDEYGRPVDCRSPIESR